MTKLVTFHWKNLILHGKCMHVLMFSIGKLRNFLIWEFDLLLLILTAAQILSVTNSVRKNILTALGQNRLLPNRPGSGITKL